MYYVSKRMEIAGSHRLTLSYKSQCQQLHLNVGIDGT